MRTLNSIIQQDPGVCHLCGSTRWIEIHHIFGGAKRAKSTKYGLVVPLCHFCHNEPPNGVHFNRKRMDSIRAEAQRKFEAMYSHDLFMKEFGRNYMDGEETETGINIADMDDLGELGK